MSECSHLKRTPNESNWPRVQITYYNHLKCSKVFLLRTTSSPDFFYKNIIKFSKYLKTNTFKYRLYEHMMILLNEQTKIITPKIKNQILKN